MNDIHDEALRRTREALLSAGGAVAAEQPRERRYMVNEVFYSVQGEGMRAGTANVFLRLSKCNMECKQEAGKRSPGGFDCDTEFESGEWHTADEVVTMCCKLWPGRSTASPAVGDAGLGEPWVVVTGGEPLLQLDNELCDALHKAGFKIAVETNGSIVAPTHRSKPAPSLGEWWDRVSESWGSGETGIATMLECFMPDWICVSPKVAEHAIRQLWAHEVKYVRGAGQAIPRTAVHALHKLISPAFNGLTSDPEAVARCLELVKENPEWRLTAQLHKVWRAR